MKKKVKSKMIYSLLLSLMLICFCAIKVNAATYTPIANDSTVNFDNIEDIAFSVVTYEDKKTCTHYQVGSNFADGSIAEECKFGVYIDGGLVYQTDWIKTRGNLQDVITTNKLFAGLKGNHTVSVKVAVVSYDDCSPNGRCGAGGNVSYGSGAVSNIRVASYNPVFSVGPASQAINEGNSVTFTAAAAPVSSYQWYKNGVAVTGATGSSYTFVATAADSGSQIMCRAYNSSLYVDSGTATLTVNAYPKITKQPVAASVNLGSQATFTCAAAPVTGYQWYKNNVVIPGATMGTYTFTPAQGDDNVSISCTAYNQSLSTRSNSVILRVNAYPIITVQPLNTVTIEDKQALISCVASSPLGVTYQWQRFKDTWENIPGETNSALIIYPTLADDQSLYRAICSNSVGNSISNTAKLTVASSSIIDITVQHPLKEIDFNKVLSASDLYAVIKYNNGNAIVSQNLDGLLFDSVDITLEDGTVVSYTALNATQYLFAELGDYTFTTKYTATIVNPNTGQSSEKTYNPIFKIKCVDKEAPAFLDTKITWDNGDEIVGLTKEPDRDVIISVLASDNVTNDSDIEYEWYKKQGAEKTLLKTFSNTNSILTVTGEMGNGIYTVIAKDGVGNTSKDYDINVTVWDLKAPEFTYEVIPDGLWSKSKDVNVYAVDDVALSDTAYYFVKQSGASGIDYETTDWIADGSWTSLNSFNVKENGTYSIYVRDRVGHIVFDSAVINKIDALPPAVELNVERSKDLKAAVIIIRAFDDGGSGLYKDNGNYDCFRSDGQTIKINDLGGQVEGRFEVRKNGIYTIATRDNAGNINSSAITIDMNKILHGGGEDELTLIRNIIAENTDGSVYPAYTNKSVRLYAEIEEDLSLSSASYCWDYEGDINEKWDETGKWTNSNSLLVTENGLYTAYFKDAEANVYRRSIEIKSIDKILPVFTVVQEGNALTLNAADAESGINKIMIDGGSLETIQELKYTIGMENVNEDVIISKNGRYKIYAFDVAGNRSDSITKDVQAIPDKEIYTVTFNNYDGAVLKSERVEEGKDAAPPNSVTREGYKFTGWDKAYTNIKANASIYAQFSGGGDKEYYTVVFENYDGAALKSQTVEKGEDAVPPSSVTRKGYTFTGWSGAYTNVQENISVKALFAQSEENILPGETDKGKVEVEREDKIYYTVIFKSFDGSILKSQAVEKSKDAVPPTNVIRKGYAFTGWSDSYANVQKDVAVNALFEEAKEDEKAVKASGTSTGSRTAASSSAGDVEVLEEIEEIQYIKLTEYSDEARPLGISQEDTQAAKIQEDKEQSFLDNLKGEGEEEIIPQTNDKIETEEKNVSPVAIVIIALTVLGIGGVTFYYLNKKYYWVALPF